MNELMFQAGVKGMSEQSELISCNINNNNNILCLHDSVLECSSKYLAICLLTKLF